MGYKMPIVCKEVYLPCNFNNDGGITLDQYREKYGIDLRDFLLFSANDNRISFAKDAATGKVKDFCKFYIVSIDSPDTLAPVMSVDSISITAPQEGSYRIVLGHQNDANAFIFVVPQNATNFDGITLAFEF